MANLYPASSTLNFSSPTQTTYPCSSRYPGLLEDMPIPAPNMIRDPIIKYLKHGFPHKVDLVVQGTTYPYEDVRVAFYSLRDCNPEMLRILNYYVFQSLSRSRIAEEAGFDPSTIKRVIDKCCDLIMQKLNHGDMMPADLFENRTVIEPEEKFEKVVSANGGVNYVKVYQPPVVSLSYSRYPKINFRLD